MRNPSKTRRGITVILALIAAGSACGREKAAGIKLHVDAEPAALRDMIDSLRVTVDGQAQIYQPITLPGSLGIRTSPGNKLIIVEGPATAPMARWEGTVVAESNKVAEHTVVLRPFSANGQDAGDASPGTGGSPGGDGAVDSRDSGGITDTGGTISPGGDGAVDSGGSVGGADTGGATQRDAGGDVRTIDGGAGKAIVVHGQLGSRGSGSASAGIYRVSRDGFVFGPRVCAGNVCQSGGIAR